MVYKPIPVCGIPKCMDGEKTNYLCIREVLPLSWPLLRFAIAAEWFSFKRAWFAPQNVSRFRTP